MGFFKKFTNKLTAPEAIVQLRLPSYSVTLGENLQGTLNVTSKEDFEATEVRCEIQCIERANVIKQVYDSTLRTNVPREVEETAVIYAAKPSLSGPTRFTNGETRDFPLNINIPAGGRPTFLGVGQRVTWTIKSVLAIDGRPDRTSSIYEIQVTTPTIQPVTQKEVIRTIVMIPCKYCQALVDQTATTCPNCGAKRTI
jgi:hypothetical protein